MSVIRGRQRKGLTSGELQGGLLLKSKVPGQSPRNFQGSSGKFWEKSSRGSLTPKSDKPLLENVHGRCGFASSFHVFRAVPIQFSSDRVSAQDGLSISGFWSGWFLRGKALSQRLRVSFELQPTHGSCFGS